MGRRSRTEQEKAAREAERLARIRRRFGNVHAAHNRRVVARRQVRFVRTVAPSFILVFGGVFTALVLSPFPPVDSLRHLAAASGCAATRGMDLESVTRGAVGYWRWNDQDGDGLACEALPAAQAELGLAFLNCEAARRADAAPVRRGRPGYGQHLDADGDGVGCEPTVYSR